MKTKERILLTALSLFNEHGENSVTSVDIAMELDISPGNLYYHYKGKEKIVAELVGMHQQKMRQVLRPQNTEALNAEEVFYYLYLVVEQLHLFRFLYRSPADLAEKYPESQRTLKGIKRALSSQLSVLLRSMSSKSLLNATSAEQHLLVELYCLIMMQSCQQSDTEIAMNEEAQRYHALSLIMVSLLPRLEVSQSHIDDILCAIDSHTILNLHREPS